MTDPNIVHYIDERYVKAGEIKVKDIRDYGEYTVSIPVFNENAEYAKNATAVFHLNFSREGKDIVLHDVPGHLLSDDDYLLIKKTIVEFLYEKESPSRILREALLHRQQNPYDKQNDYYAWRKADDSLFMIGMESYQVNHILIYEYDTYYRDYNTKLYSIDPHTVHMRGPHQFDPLEELISKTSKLEFLGTWTDPEELMDTKHGKVASYGRFELAKAHICGEKTKASLHSVIADAEKRAQEQSFSENIIRSRGIEEDKLF